MTGIATGLAQHSRYGTPVSAWAAAARTAVVEGRVTTDPHAIESRHPGPPRWLVEITMRRAQSHGTVVRASGSVLAVGSAQLAQLPVGAVVRVTGRLRPTDPGEKPVAIVQVTSRSMVVRAPNVVWRIAERARAGLRAASDGLPPDARGLLPSLVLGDTSAMPPDLKQDMTTAGLTHLTAVSGANLAIVGGGIFLLATSLGVPRPARIALAGLCMAGFCVAARPEPSVLRAAAMGAVGLLGLTTGRRAHPVPALSCAVMALLVVDPWLARAYGFALSVLATAGLVVLAPRFAARWSRLLPRWLALAIAVPIAAQLACSPLLVLLNPSVSLVCIPANLVADAAVAPATLTGVAAAAVWPVVPELSTALAGIGGICCWWIAVVARVAAGLPGSSVAWPAGLTGVALMLAVVLLCIAAWSRPVSRRVDGTSEGPEASAPKRSRQWDVVIALGLCTVLAVALCGDALRDRVGSVWRAPWPDPHWSVVLCDVGQGLAVVVKLAPRRIILLDTGGDPRLADGCLRRLGVDHLETLVLTHLHADHVGGLAGALSGRSVGRILTGPLEEPATGAEGLGRAANEYHVPVSAVLAGESRNFTDGSGWRVLWPRALDLGASRGDDEQVNDLSLVVELRTAEGMDVLVLGDVETWAQRRLLEELGDDVPHPDVVVVAHHGSADQIGDLYRQLQAPVGLIGVGADNDYGHPAQRTLAMLAAAGIRVWRSDLSGAVAVTRLPTGNGGMGLVVSHARSG
jgi:competence protein ComEC